MSRRAPVIISRLISQYIGQPKKTKMTCQCNVLTTRRPSLYAATLLHKKLIIFDSFKIINKNAKNTQKIETK